MIAPGLQGRVALVTGANHGIGAATARAPAAPARVFVTYLRLSLDEDERRAAEVGGTATPGRLFHRTRQAMTAAEVIAAIRSLGGLAEEAFGPVEVLVNNAAHCRSDTFVSAGSPAAGSRTASWSPAATVTAETHDAHFAVNSRAVALTTAEFARRHIARGARWGRIVNVSTDGASGFRGEVSYGASKHAMESSCRAAAEELGRWGITVNVVSLGPVQTGWISPELEEKEVARIPLVPR